ncbi:hypothetical protein [Streptomyces sp. NPDC003832]
MPCSVKIWIEDCDDGQFNLYIDESIVGKEGARLLEKILNSTIAGWQRLDEGMVRRALHAVTG